MPSSTMRTSVLQATTLFTFSMVLNHHLGQNMYTQLMQDEGFSRIMNENNGSVIVPSTNDTLGRLTVDAGDATNTTLSLINTTGFNNKPATNDTISGIIAASPESFYRRKLPREVAIFLVISALQYWWLIWLERWLPARPRQKEVLYQREEKVEDSEDREEEVVKKWIAQGRVRRASLNWCNTFLKWLLEVTLGRLCCFTVEHVLRVLLKLQSPRMVLSDLTSNIALNFLRSFFSGTALVTLIAFSIIPAHKQIVFFAGAELVTTVFITTLARTFAIWAVKTDFVQNMMRNITESMGQARRLDQKPDFHRHENEL